MEPQMMEGLFDNFIANLLKDALDLSKIGKPEWKSAATSFCLGGKKGTKLPGDFDDQMWDMLEGILHKQIDRLGVQDGAPITVGAAPEYVESAREFSASEVDAFLASCQCDESRKARVRGSKRIMKVLHATDKATGADVFTDDERRKVVGAFPWLMLIQLLGPLVIDLIKRWLSK
jgi:hypothetical protein